VNFQLALQVLAAHEVEYVLVGGVAVVAHGSSLMTQDLDIPYRVEANNVQRLLVMLDALTLDVFGVKVKCISLERLIAVKQALNRPRDRLAVMELQAIQKLQSEPQKRPKL
jgi:hypothetical protein